MKDILSTTFTYQNLLDMVANREKFDFSRFGDGELQCIFKNRPTTQNCDRHEYFPDLGIALKRVLMSSPNYYLGLQTLGYKQNKAMIDTWTEKFDLKWCRADILHHANIKGQLHKFFDVLNERDVLLVAPEQLTNLYPEYLKDPYIVEIPKLNCWKSYGMIKEEIGAIIDLKDWCIIYAASMMANVLIHDFQGQATQIDAGSVFDPYVGISSRGYHKKIIEKL